MLVTADDVAGPVRTCVGCRRRAHRSDLLRVVAAEVDGVWSVVPDPRRRLSGRGAWVHHDTDCLDLAERRRAFARALRRSEPLDRSALREAVTAGRRQTTEHHQMTEHDPSESEAGKTLMSPR